MPDLGELPMPSEGALSPMQLRHVGREVKTAVELAIVALCPQELLERLAATAGLLEAVAGLPVDSPPLVALSPKLMARATATLEEWAKWQEKHSGSA